MPDRWADWIRERRFGGDPEAAAQTIHELTPMRERVLESAAISNPVINGAKS